MHPVRVRGRGGALLRRSPRPWRRASECRRRCREGSARHHGSGRDGVLETDGRSQSRCPFKPRGQTAPAARRGCIQHVRPGGARPVAGGRVPGWDAGWGGGPGPGGRHSRAGRPHDARNLDTRTLRGRERHTLFPGQLPVPFRPCHAREFRPARCVLFIRPQGFPGRLAQQCCDQPRAEHPQEAGHGAAAVFPCHGRRRGGQPAGSCDARAASVRRGSAGQRRSAHHLGRPYLGALGSAGSCTRCSAGSGLGQARRH